jgi:protein-S-isoprenylcysteine O-methyltransferase Ste14
MPSLTGSFIGLCWAVFLAFILASTFSAKRVAKRDRRWMFSWIGLVVFIPIFIVVARETRLSTILAESVHRSSSTTTRFCADVVVFAGLAIALWGRMTLGRNWSLNPSIQEGHELIMRGPYVYVRHPMYSGLLLMLLGAVIWFGSWIGVIVFVVSFLGTWLKLRQEERLLTEHFGTSYLTYKERVKALIPFVL